MFSKLCCSSSKSVKTIEENENTKISQNGKPKKENKRDQGEKSTTRKALNPVVVKAIVENNVFSLVFNYLTVNELLKCRQVNKFWNKEACKVLRHKIEGVVILQRGMDYYVKLMSKSLDIPVGRVFLKLYDMNSSSVQKFFEVVGHSIIYLVLNLEGKSFPLFIEKLHCLRNLKELSLNLFDNGDEEETIAVRRKGTVSPNITPMQVPAIIIEDTDETGAEKNFTPMSSPEKFTGLHDLESIVLSCEEDWRKNDPTSLEKLISLAPNLRNLNLLKWPFPLKGDLFLNSRLEHLKFLEVRMIGLQCVEILGSKEWRFLKSIHLELSFDITPESLCTFFTSFSNTLEYLQMKNEWDEEELPFILPVTMKQLLTLRLTTWKGIVSMDSILTNAPKLDKLQLSRISPSDLELKEIKQCPSLQFLACNYEDTSHAPKQIIKALKNFIGAFPNVKYLMLKRMTDKLMELVYEGWPNLEMLNITTTFGFSDTGVTGIPVMDLKTASRSENQLPCGCYIPARPNEIRNSTYIGNLKNLTDLRIETELGTKMSITKLSLHLGFQHLTELRSLKLVSHEIGPSWCLRSIADNLVELRELTIMDRAISNDRYNEQDLIYLMRSLSNLKITFVPTFSTFTTAAHLPVPGNQ